MNTILNRLDELDNPIPEGFFKKSPAEQKRLADEALDGAAKMGITKEKLIRGLEIEMLMMSLLGGLGRRKRDDDEGDVLDDGKGPDGQYPLCKGCGERHPVRRSNSGKLPRNLTFSTNPVRMEDDPELQAIIDDYRSRGGPRVHWHNDPVASNYHIADDVVGLTERHLIPEQVRTQANIRRTVLHELAHSTGNVKHHGRMSKYGINGQRDYHREEVVVERAAQLMMKELGWLTPDQKKKSDGYIRGYAEGFELNDGMTLGEVRMEAEKDAVKAAETVLGRPLTKYKRARKATAKKSPARKELVTA